MIRRVCICVFVFVLGFSKSVDACFPGNTWINCLLNTCTVYKTCPGDPTAKCTIKRTECGCEAKFYKPTGELVECNVRKTLKSCPGGEIIVQCTMDVCSLSCSHPDFLNAPCRQNHCGQCSSEYFVHDKWVPCPSANQPSKTNKPTGQFAVQTGIQADCVNFVPCNIKICIGEKCPLEPRAVCRPDGCNECKPAWYLDNVRVNCYPAGSHPVTSNAAMAFGPETCPAGQSQVPCDISVCEQKICRNYPDAICSPDGCGKCKAVWTVGGKQVDCLSDACPADVPFVKCVADPCEVFGRYCPHAQCRATQCGKCDARFFVNGEEVDCVMQPKTCDAGVTPLNCKWFTCPSIVCPSNKRLMCRIDPCGPTCKHDWVDFESKEIMTCRVFDGEGRTIKQKSEKIFMKDPLTPFFPIQGAGKSTGGQNPNVVTAFDHNQQSGLTQPGILTQSDVVVSTGPGKFRVEPIFMSPRHIQSESDLYALLDAFKHELMGISSLSIQNVLRKGQFNDVPLPLPTVPLDPTTNINSPLEHRPVTSSGTFSNDKYIQPNVPSPQQNVVSPITGSSDLINPGQKTGTAKAPVKFDSNVISKGVNLPSPFSMQLSKLIKNKPAATIGEGVAQPVDLPLTKPVLPHVKNSIGTSNFPVDDFSNQGAKINIPEAPLPINLDQSNVIPNDIITPFGVNLPLSQSVNLPTEIQQSAVLTALNNLQIGIQLPKDVSAIISQLSNLPLEGTPMMETSSTDMPLVKDTLPTKPSKTVIETVNSDKTVSIIQQSNEAPISMSHSQEFLRETNLLPMTITKEKSQQLGDLSFGQNGNAAVMLPQTKDILNDGVQSVNTPINIDTTFQQPQGIFGGSLDLPLNIDSGLTPPKDFSFWQPENTASVPARELTNEFVQNKHTPLNDGIPKPSPSVTNKNQSGKLQSATTGVENKGLPINMDMLHHL